MKPYYVEWELVEQELLRGGWPWEAIADEVHRFSESFGDPERFERPSDDPYAVLLPVVGGRYLVTLRRDQDPRTRVLFVLSVEVVPDPDAEPDDDPREYEDDAPPASEA